MLDYVAKMTKEPRSVPRRITTHCAAWASMIEELCRSR
jgi:hypothetical protein